MIYPSMTKEKTTTTLNDGLSILYGTVSGSVIKTMYGRYLEKDVNKIDNTIHFCYYSQPRQRSQTTTDSAILAQSDIETCGTPKP